MARPPAPAFVATIELTGVVDWHSIFNSMKNLHQLLAGIILVVGLASAGLIYLTAPDNDADEILGSPIDPSSSKMYIHNLRVYGGMANVYADEFNRWFAGLWQGKSLAFTVGGIAIFASAVLFYGADLLPVDTKPEVPDDTH